MTRRKLEAEIKRINRILEAACSGDPENKLRDETYYKYEDRLIELEDALIHLDDCSERVR